MMTLFWFLAGLATCIGIARYNEDDNLFWKLFISFVGAFTAATVVKTQLENENQEKVVKVEKATVPTFLLFGRRISGSNQAGEIPKTCE